MVIAVVALIVIGPEKLPRTARTLGHLFGRLQRYVNDVKADINREIELDELRKLQQQVKTAAQDFESSMTSAAKEVETGVRSVAAELNAAGETPPPPGTRRRGRGRAPTPGRRGGWGGRRAPTPGRPGRWIPRGRRRCPGSIGAKPPPLVH